MTAFQRYAAAGADALRDLAWPRRCSGCGFRGTWLCEACLDATPVWTPPWCERCGVPKEFGCHCHELAPAIAGARALGRHVEWIQRGVHLLKYRDEMARAECFGPLLATAIADLTRPDLIVPVPLHPNRELERGYNQAALIAEALSNTAVLPVIAPRVVVRSLDTPHQIGLAAHERQKNLVGAFAVTKPEAITGKHVLVVDDVLTSGATMAEIGRALRRAGAARVDVVTVSRAINVKPTTH